MGVWDSIKRHAGEAAGKAAASAQELKELRYEYEGKSDSELISIFKRSRKMSLEWMAAGSILKDERGYDLPSL
ncbi:MAG: hypothetical protein FWG65_03245 [Turicibacter sp.]|nr:hypothetical protein [Turicibacter sp.]